MTTRTKESFSGGPSVTITQVIETAKEQASDPSGTHYEGCWENHPRCLALLLALELEKALTASLSEPPVEQEQKEETSVDSPKVMPSSGSTAAENETKDATVTPNQPNNEV